MKILIDGDGCPVVKIACNTAKMKKIKCIIICDTSHTFDINDVETIIVSKGSDSTDFFLVNKIDKGDIVVTQDYGLAAMCLARQAYVINQNGIIINDTNILSLLNNRHSAKKIRMSGGRLKGPAKRNKKNDIIFQEKLEFLIEKNLKM